MLFRDSNLIPPHYRPNVLTTAPCSLICKKVPLTVSPTTFSITIHNSANKILLQRPRLIQFYNLGNPIFGISHCIFLHTDSGQELLLLALYRVKEGMLHANEPFSGQDHVIYQREDGLCHLFEGGVEFCSFFVQVRYLEK